MNYRHRSLDRMAFLIRQNIAQRFGVQVVTSNKLKRGKLAGEIPEAGLTYTADVNTGAVEVRLDKVRIYTLTLPQYRPEAGQVAAFGEFLLAILSGLLAAKRAHI